MTIKRLFNATIAIALFACACNAFAQEADAAISEAPAVESAADTDHSLWLPKTRGFRTNNIYTAVEGRAATPPGFKGSGAFLPAGWDGSMAFDRLGGWGGGFSYEIGYDWDGWLFGVTTALWRYSESKNAESLMKEFSHIVLKANVSKIIGKPHITCLPWWLDIRIQAGVGVDFSDSRYYPSLEAKQAVTEKDLTEGGWAVGVLYNVGIFLEVSAPKYVTPYVGADFSMLVDKGGLFFMPSIILGLRTCLSN